MEKKKNTANSEGTIASLRGSFSRPEIEEGGGTAGKIRKGIRIAPPTSGDPLIEGDRPLVIATPGKEYAIIGRDISVGLFGKTIVNNESEIASFKRRLSRAATKAEAESTLISIHNGEVYNLLSVFDKKFIIALQVALSDQTEKRHYILSAHRKTSAERATERRAIEAAVKKRGRALTEEEKADILEGLSKAPAIPSLFSGMDIEGDVPPIVSQLLKSAGFSTEDIVVIIERESFLRHYLGYTSVGGSQRAKFDDTLKKLRTGLFAFAGDNSGKGIGIVSSLIDKYRSFNYRDIKGNEKHYYALSLARLFGTRIVGTYKLIPKNNAEIFNAIGDNEALFNLYDKILIEASYNFGKPGKRGDTHTASFSEEELVDIFGGGNRTYISKHRTYLLSKIYEGFNIFYEKGVLTQEVKAPTEEARKAAKEKGEAIKIPIVIRRIAFNEEVKIG